MFGGMFVNEYLVRDRFNVVIQCMVERRARVYRAPIGC